MEKRKQQMLLRKNLGERYSPLYFLASLGNGGMAIGMFIYLNFMIPHPNTSIITFDGIRPYLTDSSPVITGAILLAMAGILFFAYRHLWLLGWNVWEYTQFRKTAAYTGLVQSNANVTLMAIPLTLGMTVNVIFILGAVFVPGLWGIVEYLFPFSLIFYALTGALAFNIFSRYFTRVIATGSFDCAKNNSFSQMLSIFAFAMVAVGFAAPAAMSQTMLTAAIASFSAIFFASAAILLGIVTFVLAFRAMLEHGVDLEGSASLWVLIPILTLLGITFYRLSHAMHHHFDFHITPAFTFVLLGTFVALQLLFGGLGYSVMKQVGYFKRYLDGEGRSIASYSLICPGVALFVLGMFFVHPGLVQTGVIAKFSLPYYMLVGLLAVVQIKTILTMLQLDRKLLAPERSTPATGAEAVSPV
jgi:hypothetical protein